MARTYRQTYNGHKKCWLPDYFECDDYFHWITSTPSWWNREYHEKPMRAKTRNLLAQIKNGYLEPEEALFPVFKKPHIYYW